jgi:hypothetical protein
LKQEKFFGIPTFKAFYNLLDNYIPTTGVAEVYLWLLKSELISCVLAVAITDA